MASSISQESDWHSSLIHSTDTPLSTVTLYHPPSLSPFDNFVLRLNPTYVMADPVEVLYKGPPDLGECGQAMQSKIDIHIGSFRVYTSQVHFY